MSTKYTCGLCGQNHEVGVTCQVISFPCAQCGSIIKLQELKPILHIEVTGLDQFRELTELLATWARKHAD